MKILTIILILIQFFSIKTQFTTITLSPEVSLAYRVFIESDVTIQIKLTCQVTSWCGIAFGDSLVNTDLIRIRKDNTNIIVEDMYSKNYDAPELDDSQDVEKVSQGYDSSLIYATFNRTLQTTDITDATIKLGQNMTIIYLYSDNDISNGYDQYEETNILLYDNLSGYSCHYTCDICTGPLANQCLSCRAEDMILDKGYCKNNNITDLPVSKVITSDRFKIQWGYHGSNYIDFLLELSSMGFFGLVLGDTLTDTDVILFQVKSYYDEQTRVTHKRIEYNDMYSSSSSEAPDFDHILGGNTEIELLGYQIDSNNNDNLKIKFRRKLDTSDNYDTKLSKTNTDFMYVYHESDSTLKNYKVNSPVSFVLDLSQESQDDDNTWWSDAVRKCHTLFLFILWGPLADFSITIIRYFKGNHHYLRIHSIIFVCINSLTVLFVSLMIYQKRDEIKNFDQDGYTRQIFHFIFGIIIFIIIIVQHILGLVTKIGLESVNKRFNVNAVKSIHRILGITLFLIAKTNLMIGVRLWEEQYYGRTEGKYWFTIGVGFYYIGLFLFFILMEVGYRSEPDFAKKNRRIVYKEIEQYSQYEELIQDLNAGVSREQMLSMQKYQELDYCILGNRVYDITNLAHPGGQFILDHIKGREIGRFFYGGYTLEQFSDMATHSHRMYAQNYLNSRYIGSINTTLYNPIVPKVDKDMENAQYFLPKNVWRIIRYDEENTNQISYQSKIFEFQSEHFMVKNFLPGLKYFGLHYTIKPYGQALLVDTRQYSQILCFQKAVIHFRKQMIQYFLKTVENVDIDFFTDSQQNEMHENSNNKEIQIVEEHSDTISFIIKRMPQSRDDRGFTKFLYTSSCNTYEIEGPFGLGLGLSSLSYGNHLIFAAGTGILPFLDLFDYLLRKSIYLIIANKCSEKVAEEINPYGEDYITDLPTDFKITLYASFDNIDEFFGYKIISDLYKISEKYELDIFDCIIYFNQKAPNISYTVPTTENRFNQAFIENRISNLDDPPQKVYICGSPMFNKQIFNDCLQCDIPKSKLIYV